MVTLNQLTDKFGGSSTAEGLAAAFLGGVTVCVFAGYTSLANAVAPHIIDVDIPEAA